MGLGDQRTRLSLRAISRSKLLLSVALATVVVLLPVHDRAFAAFGGMGSHSNFGGARFNSGPRTFTHTTHVNGSGRAGQGENGLTGRGKIGKIGNGGKGKTVATGGDRPPRGDGDNPRGPRWPTWPHRPHWVVPTVPLNPVIGSIPPTNGGGQSSSGGGGGTPPLVVRRSGSGVPAVNERRFVPDEVVVEVATSTSNQQSDALARRFRLARLQSVNFQLGGTTLTRWRITDRRSVPVMVRALEADASVLSAQPNYLFALQNDAELGSAPREGDPAQYVLDKMHLPQAHELARGGKVTVAVIDSGIDVNSAELAGDIAGTFDAIGAGAKVHPHGTAIAGAIAAHGRLMGAAPAAQILAVRAFSGNDRAEDGTTFAIMAGLDWAVLHGARIINMSFAGPQDPGIGRSLAAAHDRGVVLVAAAGNKGAKSPPLFPAADRNVIAVTSTDANDQIPAFANRGPHVAVAAPGVDLMLLGPEGSMQFSSGTSYSAAYVTGTAALMLERQPGLTPDALRQALTASAHRLAPRGVDDQSGGGLVDAYQAILAVTPTAVDATIAADR